MSSGITHRSNIEKQGPRSTAHHSAFVAHEAQGGGRGLRVEAHGRRWAPLSLRWARAPGLLLGAEGGPGAAPAGGVEPHADLLNACR